MAIGKALREPDLVPGPVVFSRPVPFPGCGECREMDDAWVAATTPGSEAHDPSRATDIVVLMRRHKADSHGGSQ